MVLGFDGEIDAIYGTNSISLAIGMIYGLQKQDNDWLNQKIKSREMLDSDDPDYLPLSLRGEEAVVRWTKGGIIFVSAAFILAGAVLASVNSYYTYLLLGASTFYTYMYDMYSMINSVDTIGAEEFLYWVYATAAFIGWYVSMWSLLHKALMGTSIALDTSTIVGATLVVLASVAYTIYQAIQEFNRWQHDMNDCNNVSRESDGGNTNCSPPPPPGGGFY